MYVVYRDELYHHGIKGQKWGIRRYQNEDGSLTPAGEKRYSPKLGRTGRANFYQDRRNYIKEQLLQEHGGKQKYLNKAMKEEIEKKGLHNKYKNLFNKIDFGGVSKYLEQKMDDGAFAMYDDLDEAKRDFYAYQTNKAVAETAAGITSMALMAYAGGVGVGVTNVGGIVQYDKLYKEYDQKVKDKKLGI